MGTLWGVKFRFNALPGMHENPQRVVYTFHINQNATVVFYHSPFSLWRGTVRSYYPAVFHVWCYQCVACLSTQLTIAFTADSMSRSIITNFSCQLRHSNNFTSTANRSYLKNTVFSLYFSRMKKRQITAVNTLRTVEEWCKKHRLGISKDKSALMPMFIRNREL